MSSDRAKKRIALLGATGSVGTSAVRVLRELKDDFTLDLISAGGGHLNELAALAQEFSVPAVVIADETKLEQLKTLLPAGSKAYAGEASLCGLLKDNPYDIVLGAIVGNAAIRPVVAAIEAEHTVALASKEVMVVAGTPVMALAKRNGVQILPVDSEHSALYQCLQGHDPAGVQQLILTASGGPFRTKTMQEIGRMTWADAMKHPTWSMGPKVTLDSATLMNKALEMIEARHLFQVEPEKIGVMVHPQSIVHSMVEWTDGAVTALLSMPDMRFPVQFALTEGKRVPGALPRLDPAKIATLTFEAPDEVKFPSLGFARRAMAENGTMPAVMNAANEAACLRFRAGEIPVPGIWDMIERTMDAHKTVREPSWDELFEADRWARSYVAKLTK